MVCRNVCLKAAVLAIALASIDPRFAQGRSSAPLGRTELSNSLKTLPSAMLATAPLGARDLAEDVEFMVALQMRNYSELLARISRGEIISKEEMASTYYPLDSDYQAVLDWFSGQGLTITKTDPNHLGVFVSGTAAQVQQVLQIELAKVTFSGATYLAAVTPPSLPDSIASRVLGLNGLQSYLHPSPFSRTHLAQSGATPYQPPYKIAAISKAYKVEGVTADGAGQKIGIVIDTFPSTSDLTKFWSDNGINQSLNNIEFVQVVSGTLPAPHGEESLDVEWSSGMAPAAKIRVYASRDLSFIRLDQCYQRILNDGPSQPELRQISLSYGLGETYASTSQMQTDAQYFASMAAAGITVFAASGDGGASPGPNGQYNSGQLQVSTPSSDPSVIAVGGTNLSLNFSTGDFKDETAWAYGGGGTSQLFARPDWQRGVSDNINRVVPDVALVASDNIDGYTYAAYLVLRGQVFSASGTSWGSPVWAAFCARINQARGAAGLQSVGLLAPKIYELRETSTFRDIISGSNGSYLAGKNYDMCTGLGVPNFASLLQSLITPQINPSNILVSIGEPLAGSSTTPDMNSVREFTPDGSLVRSILFTNNPNGGSVRHIVYNPSGTIDAFNGTFGPLLTRYSRGSDSFTQTSFPYWDSVNSPAFGGIAAYQKFIYATDMDTSGQYQLNGIVRFDISANTAARFAAGTDFIDLTMGLDGKLYALAENSNIDVYDPLTMTVIGHITPRSSVPSNDLIVGIAVDQASRLFIAGSSGTVYRLNCNGALQSSTFTGFSGLTDIHLDEAGRLILGQDEGRVIIGDTTLSTFTSFLAVNEPNVSRWTFSVAFAHPVPSIAPSPISLVSRKTHDTGGTFDIDLPLTGPPGIECRAGGTNNDYQIIVTFPNAVTFNSAAVSSGIGTVSAATGSGTASLIVNLIAVTNAQTVTLTLSGVNDGTTLGDIGVRMGVLVGDTNADGLVNSGDIAQTKSQSGFGLTNSNFREDLNADGLINSGDIALVKSKSGTALP